MNILKQLAIEALKEQSHFWYENLNSEEAKEIGNELENLLKQEKNIVTYKFKFNRTIGCKKKYYPLVTSDTVKPFLSKIKTDLQGSEINIRDVYITEPEYLKDSTSFPFLIHVETIVLIDEIKEIYYYNAESIRSLMYPDPLFKFESIIKKVLYKHLSFCITEDCMRLWVGSPVFENIQKREINEH